MDLLQFQFSFEQARGIAARVDCCGPITSATLWPLF
jgi:hypothetical protein